MATQQKKTYVLRTGDVVEKKNEKLHCISWSL